MSMNDASVAKPVIIYILVPIPNHHHAGLSIKWVGHVEIEARMDEDVAIRFRIHFKRLEELPIFWGDIIPFISLETVQGLFPTPSCEPFQIKCAVPTGFQDCLVMVAHGTPYLITR